MSLSKLFSFLVSGILLVALVVLAAVTVDNREKIKRLKMRLSEVEALALDAVNQGRVQGGLGRSPQRHQEARIGQMHPSRGDARRFQSGGKLPRFVSRPKSSGASDDGLSAVPQKSDAREGVKKREIQQFVRETMAADRRKRRSTRAAERAEQVKTFAHDAALQLGLSGAEGDALSVALTEANARRWDIRAQILEGSLQGAQAREAFSSVRNQLRGDLNALLGEARMNALAELAPDSPVERLLVARGPVLRRTMPSISPSIDEAARGAGGGPQFAPRRVLRRSDGLPSREPSVSETSADLGE